MLFYYHQLDADDNRVNNIHVVYAGGNEMESLLANHISSKELEDISVAKYLSTSISSGFISALISLSFTGATSDTRGISELCSSIDV